MGKVTQDFIFDKEKGKQIRIQCNNCIRETNHEILCGVDDKGSEELEYEGHGDGIYIYWYIQYQTLKCLGCDTISFRKHTRFSEWDEPEEKLYPERGANLRSEADIDDAPAPLLRIYKETISAFNDGCYTLCAAGLRSMVEGICHDKGIDGGEVKRPQKGGGEKIEYKENLEGKISGLCEKGFLTQPHANILHEHRYLGNEALHELSAPTKKELVLAIDIIEHTIEQLYELPSKAEELKTHTGKRKGRTP